MKRIIFGGFLLFSSFSFALELTVDEAVERAYDYNYSIKQSEKELESSKIRIREAYKDALPEINLNSSYSGEEGDEASSEDFGFSSSVSITQPIYTGGTVRTAVKSAKIYENLSKEKHADVKREIRLFIIDRYVEILKLEDQLNVYKKSMEERMESYNKIKTRYELKMVARPEFLKLEASLSEAEAAIIDAENRIRIEKIRLKKNMGVKSKSEELDLERVDVVKYKLDAIELEADIDRALDKGITAKLSKYNTRLTEASEVIARSELLPKINFQLSYSTYDQASAPEVSFVDSIDKDWQWTAGFNFTWNVFDWGQNLDVYKRSKNDSEIAKYQELGTLDTLEVSIRSAYANIENLNKLIEVKKKLLESEMENFKLDKLRFENGLIAAEDYLRSETSLRQAEVDLSDTILDYYVAYETYLSFIN